MKENLQCVDCGVLGVRMAALTERQMSEAPGPHVKIQGGELAAP